jgi:hypothetical protein
MVRVEKDIVRQERGHDGEDFHESNLGGGGM